MRTLVVIFSLVVVGCSSPPPGTPPTPQPAAPLTQPTLVATATLGALPTVVATARSTSVNYPAIVQPMLIPLGALIVAVRAGTPTADFWVAEFNKAADNALPAIEGDQSPTAQQLRASILDIKAMPKNLQVLEDSRSKLLMIR